VHGPVAEPADHLVPGDRVGVGDPEPGPHPLPELGQSHAVKTTSGNRRRRWNV
jgi:hypothetical protein